MSTYFAALLVTVWDWVVAPPLNWLLSLSREWQIELGALLILAIFLARIVENTFVGRELLGEWWAERKRHREWYRIGAMEPPKFHAAVKSIRRDAETEIRLAEKLEGRAGNGLAGHILRRAAFRRRTRAQAFHDEADRLEQLWKAIEKEREKNGNDSAAARPKVLRLMRRLESTDEYAAHGALSDLKRMSNWFDWECLAPREMSPPQRDRLVKSLKLMASTTSLNEAQTAYRTAFGMLRQNNWDDQWETA